MKARPADRKALHGTALNEGMPPKEEVPGHAGDPVQEVPVGRKVPPDPEDPAAMPAQGGPAGRKVQTDQEDPGATRMREVRGGRKVPVVHAVHAVMPTHAPPAAMIAQVGHVPPVQALTGAVLRSRGRRRAGMNGPSAKVIP